MKFSRHLSFTVLVVSMLWLEVNAQLSAVQSVTVPRLVNYSGKAVDVQGKAISGIAGATFSIYKDQYESAPLWMETQNIRVDEAGTYTAQLGATKPEGLPLELFSSAEARWLGVRINGGEEQPRVLLLSVPYALKAADAQTLGGLPPSAFMMAAAPSPAPTTPDATASNSVAKLNSNGVITALGGSGSPGFVPLWTTSSNLGNSALFQSGTGSSAKVGLGTTAPASTLDVQGAGTIRGLLSLPATGTATASKGFSSQPLNLAASSFNSNAGAAVNQNFRWQTEPTGNNTTTPSGTINLLFNSGNNPPGETGLKIASNGRITFAAGQTYPGAGTVTSVGLSAPSSDFTVGSPVTHSGNLGLNWKIAPTSGNTPNAIVKRDTTGSFAATQVTTSSLLATGPATAVQGTSTGGGVGISGQSGSGIGVYGSSSGIGVYGASAGSQAIWGESTATGFSNGSGPDGVHGVTHSNLGSGVGGINWADSGVGIWGEAPSGVGFYTPNNVRQARTGNGWIKAMAFVNAEFPPYSIVRCFNSFLDGAAATTPPCGINFNEVAFGNWLFDFGFEVDDRFVNVSMLNSRDASYIACDSSACPISPSQLSLSTFDGNGSATSATFSLIVY